jgi:hypothetical protein
LNEEDIIGADNDIWRCNSEEDYYPMRINNQTATDGLRFDEPHVFKSKWMLEGISYNILY